MPGGHEKPLPIQSTTDLWVGILGFPAFGSLFVAVPMIGTPTDGSRWTTFWAVSLFVGFFLLAGVLLGVPRLKELRRRREWVPPGTARRPVLVSTIMVLLILAAGAFYMIAGGWVGELAVAAGLGALYAGLLGSAIAASLAGLTVLAVRRWARRAPGAESNGTTDLRDGSEPPGTA
jgi:hypothetical protein